ncbi:MAG: hypothetical protein Q7U99_14755 [Rubrivivax sp.]|nr:hypothetical protein [Rubrivivax sp.]
MNIGGVLVCSRGFTNAAINEADLVVMSDFGQPMIVVWGLAYLGAASVGAGARWLATAFAIERPEVILPGHGALHRQHLLTGKWAEGNAVSARRGLQRPEHASLVRIAVVVGHVGRAHSLDQHPPAG